VPSLLRFLVCPCSVLGSIAILTSLPVDGCLFCQSLLLAPARAPCRVALSSLVKPGQASRQNRSQAFVLSAVQRVGVPYQISKRSMHQCTIYSPMASLSSCPTLAASVPSFFCFCRDANALTGARGLDKCRWSGPQRACRSGRDFGRIAARSALAIEWKSTKSGATSLRCMRAARITFRSEGRHTTKPIDILNRCGR
jgi:hypothetical protein